MSRDTLVTGDTSSLSELVALRRRVNALTTALYRSVEQPERYAEVRRRLVQFVVSEYLPALTDYQALTPPDVVRRQRDETERRLSIGWTVEKPGADDRFAYLVAEYEALTDCLDDDAVAPMLDRIALLDGVTA